MMTDAFDRGTLDVFLKPWAEGAKKSLSFVGWALGRLVKKVDNKVVVQKIGD